MQLTQFLVLAGVLGAAAHPSGHMHLHRSAHAKRDPGQVYVKNVHNKPIPKPTTTAAPPAPTTTAEVLAAAATPASSSSSSDSDSSDSNSYVAFCGSSSKAKRVTYEQVMYTGNVGTAGGCKWNSNMMVVPNGIADQYDYVQKYTNVAKETYQVICANKMDRDGQLTGMFKVKGQDPLIFNLEPGETKTVVADSNTQGVCAFAPKEVPTTSFGQYAGVWAEFDFSNTSNEGWSGADCSSLVAQHYDMDVPGCRMSQGGIDSTILPGGIGTNAYTKGMEKEDGIGLNIPAGKTTIEVKVGFSG